MPDHPPSDSGRGPIVLASARATWGDVALTLSTQRIDHRVEWSDHHPEHHLVIVNLGGRVSRIDAESEAAGGYRGAPVLGELSVIPAGDRFGGTYQGDIARFARLQVHKDAAQALLGHGTPAPAPRLGAQDRFIFAAIEQLAGLVNRSDPQAVTYGEALAQALILHVADVSRRRGPNAARPAAAPLDRVAREAVEAHLERHLGDPIRVADLATAAGLPLGRFLRSFRQSYGASPARWITAARVRRAKWLLSHTDEPLALVAYRVGFANQSHLTNTFRAFERDTPARYRRRARAIAETLAADQ